MLFIILICVSLLAAVIFTILSAKGFDFAYTISTIFWGAFAGLGFVSIILLPAKYVNYKKRLEIFQEQKFYLEEIVPNLPDSDNCAITQSKIEQNQILHEMKADYKRLSFILFLPSEIEDEEPIK